MNIREKLMAIAKDIAATNPDIRLAYNEEDNSIEENKEAAHFLKYKDKRIGRDIELYAFMAELSSEIVMLCDFLEEIIFPLKLQGSTAEKSIFDWGLEILPEDSRDAWAELFVIGGEDGE